MIFDHVSHYFVIWQLAEKIFSDLLYSMIILLLFKIIIWKLITTDLWERDAVLYDSAVIKWDTRQKTVMQQTMLSNLFYVMINSIVQQLWIISDEAVNSMMSQTENSFEITIRNLKWVEHWFNFKLISEMIIFRKND